MSTLKMSSTTSQNQRHLYSSKNNKKKRLSQEQVRLLEASFDANNRLDPERKLQLARELDIPSRQIAIWYQNKRARWKNQSLEMEYSALHMRLEATLGQKRQLEKEVQRMKIELRRSQAEVASYRQLQMQYNSQVHVLEQQHQPQQPQQQYYGSFSNSLSSNCDDGGSSSFNDHDQINGSWMNEHYGSVSNSLSSNCDEVGSSSFNDHDQINGSWMNEHEQALRLEDLYACLMGTN